MSEPKLALLARKNIKEYEERTKEALEKIQAALELNCEVTLDAGFAALEDWAGKQNRKNCCGSIAFDYVDALKSRFEREYKDETSKEAMQTHWTTAVLKIEPGTKKKGESGYQRTEIRDGDLVVTVFEHCNVSDTGRDLMQQLGDNNSGLPVKAVQNLKEHEEKKSELCSEIQEACGLPCEVTIDVDWSVVHPICVKCNYGDRIGDIVYGNILGALRDRMVRICKDELTKEAVAEAWTTGVVRLAPQPKIASGYHACDFVDGDLVISFKPDNISTNVSDIGRDIESKL